MPSSPEHHHHDPSLHASAARPASGGRWAASFEPLDFGREEDRGAAGIGPDLQVFLVANYARLHRRLMHHLGCPDLASDSLHDAWIRLGDRASAQAAQSPEAYVYRVACNAATDRLRADRSWQYASDAETELEHLVDLSPGPEAIADARSELAAVERALQHLPQRHRSVLIGLRIEEMTREEVARRCDLSLRRVDTVLRRTLDHCASSVSVDRL
jgi:RNA polymerase sigma factor (sigma-70 family)